MVALAWRRSGRGCAGLGRGWQGRGGLVDAVGGCRAVCATGAPGARSGVGGDASWGVPFGGPGGGAEAGAAMEDGGFTQPAEWLWNEASQAMLR